MLMTAPCIFQRRTTDAEPNKFCYSRRDAIERIPFDLSLVADWGREIWFYSMPQKPISTTIYST